jgi:hypothetical protein
MYNLIKLAIYSKIVDFHYKYNHIFYDFSDEEITEWEHGWVPLGR